MATTFLLPVLVAASLSAPCDHVKGTGDVVKKTVPVGSFHGILVEGAIDVEVTPGTAQQVEIEAQANLIELVTTDVRNGIWTIGTGEKGYSTDKPFVVHITVPSIDRVAIEGSGDVKALGAFTADEVELSVQGSGDLSWTTDAKSIKTTVQGSGDIRLTGSCTALTAAVQGSGDINARGLSAGSASASTSGSGDIIVNTSGELTASVEGSGDVVYQGSPAQVRSSVNGSGEVRPAGAGHGPR